MTVKIQHNDDGTISLSKPTARWLVGIVLALAANLVAVVTWGVSTSARLDSLIEANAESRETLKSHAAALANHDSRIVRLETIGSIRNRE